MTQSNKPRHIDIFFWLTRRHLLVFSKNKVRLMYTLLVPVIIFVVYLFFLRDLELDGINSGLVQMSLDADATPALKESISALVNSTVIRKDICTLVDTWMISGIIGLTAITVSLQADTVIVEDKQNGVNRDFVSSPILRSILIASYFFFNFIITTLICVVFLFICLVYLACMGELALSVGGFFAILGVLLLSTVASTLTTVFIGTFIESEGTLAAVVAVFSTAVGFLIGAYMPLGMLPVWVQGICGFIPGTYSCALLRFGFMSTPIAELSTHLSSVVQPGLCARIMSMLTTDFGYALNFFGTAVNERFQTLALAIFIAAFAALDIAVGNRVSAVSGLKKPKRKKQ